MGTKRVGDVYFGTPERFGCLLLILLSVGGSALFALWATFIYRPPAPVASPPPVSEAPSSTLLDLSPVPPTSGPSPTLILAPSSTPIPSATPEPARTPTPTGAPPLPPPPPAGPVQEQVFLESMSHEYQKLNNCGPVSLAAAASFFGAQITQFDAAEAVKGGPEDRNVSPPEMVDYLRSLGLGAVYRVNGSTELMQKLLANNLPVIVHQWLVRPHDGVLVGHYRVLRGYDAKSGLFFANDPYIGPRLSITYDQFDDWWRPFNRGYIPVYRPEQEPLVAALLGENWDEETNHRLALAQAQLETQTLADGYAFFNLGDEYLTFGDLAEAVSAYNTAFTFEFPDHFLWYNFGPLEAFNEVGDYQRVLDITDQILEHAGELEEARLQRGIAYQRLGDMVSARAEFEKSLAANSRYDRAQAALDTLGSSSP